jgi:hypothetical protein
VLHWRSRRSVGRGRGGALAVGRGWVRRSGCWSLVRGRRCRGLGRLEGARDGPEAGVVGRDHGDGDALWSNGSRRARGMLGAVRGRRGAVRWAVNACTPARPGGQTRLGSGLQDAARSRWTAPQRQVVAGDARELWRAAVGGIGSSETGARCWGEV